MSPDFAGFWILDFSPGFFVVWESLGSGSLTLNLGWGQGKFVFREFSTNFYSEWRYSVDARATWCVHPEVLAFDLREKCGTSSTD